MSRFRAIAVGMLVATVAVLATAAPASAHDALVHSSPESDERLAVAPESVTLTFSGELLTLGDDSTGSVVLVVDESGRDWAAGPASITSRTATVALEPGMPEAGYQVRWQVISSDGHPITGVIPFTIGDAAPMALPGGSDADSDAVGEPLETGQSDSQPDGAVRMLLVGGGGAATAVIALLVFLFLRRRKTAPVASVDHDTTDEQL